MGSCLVVGVALADLRTCRDLVMLVMSPVCIRHVAASKHNTYEPVVWPLQGIVGVRFKRVLFDMGLMPKGCRTVLIATHNCKVAAAVHTDDRNACLLHRASWVCASSA